MTKNKGYYVTVETLVSAYLTLDEAKNLIRTYKGEGLLHLHNDGINGLRP